LDHLNNLQQLSPFLLAGTLFMTGIMSSLHCVGMCGGLVTSTCQKSHQQVPYQTGRLLGYMAVVLVASLIGFQFQLFLEATLARVIMSLLLSSVFIAWGLSIYRGKSLIKTQKILTFTQDFWGSAYKIKNGWPRSFAIGLLSPLLPCGMFYGVILALMISQNIFIMSLGVFFFWLGTLPSLVMTPTLLQKIINPLQQKYPKALGLSLISLGLLAVNFRTIINGVLYVCH
jgi:sulfite exporter TauE/SafE